MNGQAKISSFFKPIGAARVRVASDVCRNTMPKAKRFKSDVAENQVRGENKSPEKRVVGTHDERLIDIADKTKGLVVHIGSSWYDALQEEFNKSYFQKLSGFVSTERGKFKVYPLPCEVFTWTQNCPIKKVKVVILGQDPYHGPGQAHGLCFSVPDGIQPPPSLLNMYKELASDIDNFSVPDHGNLTSWAEQGVLLLNACLTVQAHQANSHKDKGWEQFTDSVIKWLNKNLDGVVFLLWGAYAQKKGQCIDKKRHHVLKSVHPSPLSAHRGFFGCKHFSQTNAILEKQDRTPVDWRL